MKIYLAGSCSSENRTIMVHVAEQLRQCHNIEVYCPWELKIENAWDKSQEEWAREVFEEDIKAIQDCDIFLMISQGRESTAGTNWENGYAYGLNKHIIIIQITDKPTSLMTYASSSYFYFCPRDELHKQIAALINNWERYGLYSGRSESFYRCKTVLT